MRFHIRFILLLFALAIASNSGAQVLKGIVVNAETGEPMYSVTVVNVKTQQSTYSNQGGEFTLSAKSGDLLAFSSIGYETQKRTMPPTLNIANMRIEMPPMSFELENVIVRPGYTPYQRDSLERRKTFTRAMSRQKTTSIMSPFSLVAERLSKRSKQAFAFQKGFNYWEGERFIDSRYTPELVHYLTGLEGDTLAYFMNAFPMPYDYARGATDLELKMWVRYNYKQWLLNPKIPLIDSVQNNPANGKNN